MGRLTSTSYATSEAVKLDALRCDEKKLKTVLDAELRHIMVCLQVCLQYIPDENMQHVQNRAKVSRHLEGKPAT